MVLTCPTATRVPVAIAVYQANSVAIATGPTVGSVACSVRTVTDHQ